MPFRCDINPNEEPEPIAADTHHQCTDVPKQAPDRWCGRGRRCIEKHHDRRRDEERHEAVHGQQVSDPAVGVAEFSRRQDVLGNRLESDRTLFSAAQRYGCCRLRLLGVLEEILGASLVPNVEQRAANDQQKHNDNICLHHAGRNIPGELSEGVQ